MRTLTISLIVLTALFTASETAAQNRVQIVGRVLDDSTDQPIPGVHLVARDPHDAFLGSATSNDEGRFSFVVYRQQAVRIYAARIGYKNMGTPLLRFDGSQYYEVEVRLHPEALVVAPLEVIARAGSTGSPVLSGFRERLVGGMGHYITRADIERLRPNAVTDLLREVPGVRLTSSGSGMSRVIQIGRSEARACAVQLYVDGMHVNRAAGAGAHDGNYSIDDFVHPASVEGIEVYRGLSTIPAEFFSPGAECGVVAVWTRRGYR